MANPTNINVPPVKAADPTNVSVPVHGTRFPSGLTGADQVVTLSQGSDITTNITDAIVDSWIAPYNCFLRIAGYQSYAATATSTFRILNNTTSTAVVGATTPTAGTAAALTFSSLAARTVSAGDEIQLLTTTSGGGTIKGLNVHVMFTQLAGTATAPV